jgi:hypothetical protein
MDLSLEYCFPFQPVTEVFILNNAETGGKVNVISYQNLSNQLLFVCT